MSTQNQPAVLVLKDGTVFHGNAAGVIGTTTGEIAFNTGMYGYQEIFTDPSYHGQIVVMATAHIGNYGTHPEETESDGIKISGLVAKKFSQVHSRESSDMSLQDYLEKDKKVGICNVDTRALVRHIREAGAMNAIISSEILDVDVLKEKLDAVPSMEGLELSSKVTSKAFEVNPEGRLKVALLDLGVKKNIIRCLAERDCYVKVFPMQTSIEEMTAWNPDGFMISNGPGDPAAMVETAQLVNNLILTGKPMFGICLGHQIIATSQGLSTIKMFNGHRGVNHPVKNLITGLCEITSQNHGFVVDMKSAEANKDIEVTHIHLNDDTLAGIRLKKFPVFSVQYHPEASAGPHDSRYLFDQFIQQLEKSTAHNLKTAQA
jgi:carbamoyl-phosphate synthase small subunit